MSRGRDVTVHPWQIVASQAARLEVTGIADARVGDGERCRYLSRTIHEALIQSLQFQASPITARPSKKEFLWVSFERLV